MRSNCLAPASGGRRIELAWTAPGAVTCDDTFVRDALTIRRAPVELAGSIDWRSGNTNDEQPACTVSLQANLNAVEQHQF